MADKQNGTKTAASRESLEASKQAAMEAYSKLLEARDHFGRAAGEAGMDLQDEAFAQLRAGRDRALRAEKQAERYTQDKPLQALGIAFLAGLLLSTLFSITRR